MATMVIMVIFVIGGVFLWLKVIQPMMSGKYGQLATDAQKEFEERGAEIRKEAFENPQKFGAFKTIIPDDETLLAIGSYLEPRSITKNLLGEAATAITRVRKVNMCHFYFILTDKSLHAVAFNGENTVSHDIFDLDEIKDVKFEKAGSNYAAGLKDALSGVEGGGQYEKLKFTYKDKKYEYNLERVVTGFPMFDVRKDSMSGDFYRIYKAYGEKDEVYDYKSKTFYIDSTFRSELYREFKEGIGKRYGVEIPA